jgi:hypothetical protein
MNDLVFQFDVSKIRYSKHATTRDGNEFAGELGGGPGAAGQGSKGGVGKTTPSPSSLSERRLPKLKNAISTASPNTKPNMQPLVCHNLGHSNRLLGQQIGS